MNRFASVSSAFMLLALTVPQVSTAMEGGGEVLLLPVRPSCAGFVGAARADVQSAESLVKTLKVKKASAKQQRAAGQKLNKAKLKLAKIRSGSC